MKKIKNIKNQFLSRQVGVAKLAIKMGKNVWENRDKNLKDKLHGGIAPHVESIVNELGVMKGSLMKAGQMLSTYAGAFLPAEAQKVLKQLENESYYLSWDQMKERIPAEFLSQLEISEEPLAAASLGQVHEAYRGSQKLVMKIQYKGVRKAIKNDVLALKLLMKAMNVIPKEINLKEIYAEIEEMLFQETDYEQEAKNLTTFKESLSHYPQYTLPSVYPEFSNERILTMDYLDGYNLRNLDQLNLTQEQRNKLGEDFMRLLFIELFEVKRMQTDVHMGNYVVLQDLTWGLIDFGATKEPPAEFLKGYQTLIIACANKDRELFFENLYRMEYLSKTKETNEDFFWEYAQIIGEPFQAQEYDWGTSQIADKALEMIPRIVKEVSVGNPSRHTVFLDRKIGGVFFILQTLKAKFNVRKLLAEYENRE